MHWTVKAYPGIVQSAILLNSHQRWSIKLLRNTQHCAPSKCNFHVRPTKASIHNCLQHPLNVCNKATSQRMFEKCHQVRVARSLKRTFHSSSLDRCPQDETVMNVFNRKAKWRQRDRAAKAEDVEIYDYLKDEVAYRLVDRLRDVTRTFPVAADIGSGRGHIAKHLTDDLVGKLYQCEMSSLMLDQSPDPEGIESVKMQVDEEDLPFEPEVFDLVLSSLSLHWVNDLPGCLQQIHNCLKRDGPFIGSVFGGDTLFELRCSLQLAEIEREGDVEEITVNYPSLFELLIDLKGMAENNASWSRKILHRDTLMAAAAIYKEMYGNEDGSIPATFQILFMIGWKPDISQAKPAKRGSAEISFKDLENINNPVEKTAK
ncbi:arginine-hydroxylase NDUFAF5, mitochondrial-like isoform X2 [Apostichopus japonicus]|uniref:arginine-hydroxylase NDUFAF5, mitochondrial-like isoform X2 n=1 Tax=Stichopus japonicus TaxID=307972 RepID=UPI003AB2FF93